MSHNLSNSNPSEDQALDEDEENQYLLNEPANDPGLEQVLRGTAPMEQIPGNSTSVAVPASIWSMDDLLAPFNAASALQGRGSYGGMTHPSLSPAGMFGMTHPQFSWSSIGSHTVTAPLYSGNFTVVTTESVQTMQTFSHSSMGIVPAENRQTLPLPVPTNSSAYNSSTGKEALDPSLPQQRKRKETAIGPVSVEQKRSKSVRFQIDQGTSQIVGIGNHTVQAPFVAPSSMAMTDLSYQSYSMPQFNPRSSFSWKPYPPGTGTGSGTTNPLLSSQIAGTGSYTLQAPILSSSVPLLPSTQIVSAQNEETLPTLVPTDTRNPSAAAKRKGKGKADPNQSGGDEQQTTTKSKQRKATVGGQKKTNNSKQTKSIGELLGFVGEVSGNAQQTESPPTTEQQTESAPVTEDPEILAEYKDVPLQKFLEYDTEITNRFEELVKRIPRYR